MIFELNLQTVLFAVGIAWGAYQGLCWLADRYGWSKKRQEMKLMKEASINLLREVIRWNYQQYVKGKGVIDEDDLAHLEEVYEAYSGLGGNGTATRWMEELKDLPRI